MPLGVGVFPLSKSRRDGGIREASSVWGGLEYPQTRQGTTGGGGGSNRLASLVRRIASWSGLVVVVAKRACGQRAGDVT